MGYVSFLAMLFSVPGKLVVVYIVNIVVQQIQGSNYC